MGNKTYMAEYWAEMSEDKEFSRYLLERYGGFEFSAETYYTIVHGYYYLAPVVKFKKQFTPGPWGVTSYNDKCVLGLDGDWVVSWEGFARMDKEAAANALLTSKAPAMFDMLETIVSGVKVPRDKIIQLLNEATK